MRHVGLSMLLVLLSASALSASEGEPTEEVVPRIVESAAEAAAPEQAPELNLEEVVIHESEAPEDAPVAQLGPRGSFWWLVGVVVVAGVILALVL